VDDQPVTRVVLDAVVAKYLPGLRCVVLLVEDRVAPSVGEPTFRNRVKAASAVITAVMAQPCNRSIGPKSGAGIKGAGLITGTARGASTTSGTSGASETSGLAGGAVTRAIVGCAL